MSKKDSSRKWIWIFLAVLVASQLYFVRELFAAFALFFLAFAALGSVIAAVYFAQKIWETGVSRLFASRAPWVIALRRLVANVEDFARRPIRRPGSEPTNA